MGRTLCDEETYSCDPIGKQIKGIIVSVNKTRNLGNALHH